ncbi:MAG: hypothetical protein LJE93_12900 [Acidobacteria bacterium]|nr:hypothetical protein [Acidobacteriota bacterium]
MKYVVLSVALALGASMAAASESIPFDSPRWQIEAEESRVEPYQGKTSLVLRGGLALVPDADFTNGVIEYFCAFPEARAFAGATWRVQDAANREEFYIRPHQSGNPDANQYTPIFNGLSAWQLYHGEGYGTPVEYEFDSWFPVRIVVSGDEAEVYIRDLETPALFIDDLKRNTASGAVGLAVPNFGAVRFAEFRYQKIDDPPLHGRVERTGSAPDGATTTWQISKPFAEKMIDEMTEIPSDLESGLAWTGLRTEPSGLANLSRVSVFTREANTVFAKFTIVSDRPQTKIISFGYSDRLRLFLSGKLLYVGNNTYRSRDYRYLGTIGFFDSVALPLQKGRNELWFAVSESFGGWGVQAAFGDTEGLELPE